MRWERMGSASSSAVRWASMVSAEVEISDQTSASSSVSVEVVSLGAAATRPLLNSATPNAASISGTLPSFTLAWASPTLWKLNQPMRLAATVRATATPKAANNWVEIRNRSAIRRFSKSISPQLPAVLISVLLIGGVQKRAARLSSIRVFYPCLLSVNGS